MLISKLTKARNALTTEHDRKLSEFLQQISLAVETAQTKDELISVINQVKAFGSPLKFKHSRYKLLAVTTGFVATVTGVFSDKIYAQWNYSTEPLSVLFAFFTMTLIFFMCRENVDVQSISRRLFFRALLFDKKLKEITSEFVPIESRLFNNYCEFNRGNYSRSITEGYTGRYQGNTYAFDYIFYHFHYVDKRTERITDSEGRSTFQTFHYHYDRYGIELDFRLVRLLAITSKSICGFDGKRYKTSSNRFNRHFRVITGDEMTAARFLKPAVVLVCEEITNKFRELNLEFNKQGGLIMSFDNKKVLHKTRQFDLNYPDEFTHEVSENNSLPELYAALEFIHTLMLFSDNNFKEGNK